MNWERGKTTKKGRITPEYFSMKTHSMVGDATTNPTVILQRGGGETWGREGEPGNQT